MIVIAAIATLAVLAGSQPSGRGSGDRPLPATGESDLGVPAPPPGGVGPVELAPGLNLVDNRLLTPGTEPTVLLDPVSALYDSGSGIVYVRGSPGNLLGVLNLTTDRITTEIAVPAESYPGGFGTPTMAVAPNGTVYVAGDTGTVDVLNPFTERVTGSYPIGKSPTSIVYDPSVPALFVSEWILNQVVVIDLATGATTVVGVGQHPGDLLATPTTVFVANVGSSNVSLISTETDSVYASAPTGSAPLSLANDSVDGLIAVADSGSANLTLISDAYPATSGERNITVGSDPVGVTYDPGNDAFYVANNGSDNITVVLGATNATSSVSLGAGSEPVAVDLLAGGSDLAVLDSADDSVTSLSEASNAPVATVSLADGALYGGAADAGDGELIAVSTGDYSVASTTGSEAGAGVLSGDPLELRDVVPLQTFPTGVAYDPANDRLLVADPAGDEIYEVDAATEQIVGNVSAGAYPTALGFDPASDTVYVLGASGEVTFLAPSGSSLRANGTLDFGAEPTAFAEDPTLDEAFVTLSDGDLVVFNATNDSELAQKSVQPGADFASMVFAPAAQKLYIATGTGRDELDILDVAPKQVSYLPVMVSVGVNPGSVALDPASGAVFVANWGNATALPSVSVVSDTSNTVVATIENWTLPDAGNLSFDSTTNELFNAELGNGFVDSVNASTYASSTPEFALGSTNNTSGIAYVPATFGVFVTVPGRGTVTELTNETEYPVVFSEAGLPDGTSWQVDLAGSVATSSTGLINFTALNGSYAFSVPRVPGYVANESSGTVTVRGAPVDVPLTFGSTAARDYPVNFTESGLPSSTFWSVTLNGSAGSSSAATISFSVPNGTYPYTVGDVAGYDSNVSSSSVNVASAGVNVSVGFSPAPGPSYYAINFTESGLTPATRWAVTLNGTGLNSSSPTIEFVEPDGTYSFTIGAVPGYVSRVSTGSLTVRGGPLTVPVAFAPTVLFNVSFVEMGLPGGTAWSVSLDGASPVLGSTAMLNFSEPNATYTFSVGTVAGYSASPGNGSFSVTGRAVAIDVTYATSGTGSSTSPTLLAAIIGVGVILFIVVLVGVLFFLGRRGKAPPVFENDVLATGPGAPDEWDESPGVPRS